MKKEILIGLALFFAVATLTAGCGKSDEKMTEAPPSQKQTIQDKAPAASRETMPKVESAAIRMAREHGQQEAESTIGKMPDEVRQAVDTALDQYRGQGGQAETVEAKPPHELETK